MDWEGWDLRCCRCHNQMGIDYVVCDDCHGSHPAAGHMATDGRCSCIRPLWQCFNCRVLADNAERRIIGEDVAYADGWYRPGDSIQIGVSPGVWISAPLGLWDGCWSVELAGFRIPLYAIKTHINLAWGDKEPVPPRFCAVCGRPQYITDKIIRGATWVPCLCSAWCSDRYYREAVGD